MDARPPSSPAEHRTSAPASPRVLVTGALGNVGGEVLRALSAQGLPARAADRSAERARAVLGEATETVSLDFMGARTFEPALEGCGALFLLRPPAISDVKPTLNRLVDVAVARGVRHGVFLSVAGAGTNTLVPHHAVEHHVGLRFGQAEQVDPTLTRLLGHPGHTLRDYVRDHASLWSVARRPQPSPMSEERRTV